MPKLIISRISLFLLSIISIQQTQTALDNSGGCVYSFEVWTPDQNVLRRMRHLEHQCTNASLQSERHLASIKSQVLVELFKAQNMSNSIEKELLELKLEDVQLKVTQRDLRLELLELKTDTQELSTSLDEMKIKGVVRHSKGASHAELQGFRSELTGVKTMVGQLKNGVGDLKAEWMLIKREVQGIKSENSHIKNSQAEIKDETMKMKEMIEEIQTDTQQLKNQQSQLGSRGSFNARPEDGENEVEVDENYRVQQQITELTTETTELRREMEDMKKDNVKLRREVLAVAVAGRNITPSEVDDLLLRLPTIDVPHPASTNQGSETLPRDCHDIYRQGFRTSGVYQIKPDASSQQDNVYCEMLNNTGWTMLQRRRDGLLTFNRGWLEYKYGFGNLYGDFWMGNEAIHRLTTQRQTHLRIDMWDWEGQRSFAEYDYVRVDGEQDKYMLHVRGYKGDAGDSMSYHDEMSFSTEDNDNDLHRRNCAQENKGGWWFNSCYSSNLNGVYRTGWYSQRSQTYSDGIVWYTLKESELYSLKHVEIKIRPTYT